MASQRQIETSRLVLRGAQPSDAEDLYECFSDPEVMRYWDTLPHENHEATNKWVEKMMKGKNNGISDFVICLKSEPNDTTSSAIQQEKPMKVIGKVGIWQGDEIGFLLHRGFWGKGLAVEAVREVLDLGFGIGSVGLSDSASAVRVAATEGPDDETTSSSRGLRQDVVADVDPRNQASLGILRKLGFEVYEAKEKTFQIGGEWVDSVYLSLKRDIWLKKRETL